MTKGLQPIIIKFMNDNHSNNLYEILNNINYILDEANYAVVTENIWPKIVAYYPHNRLYYVKSGYAKLFCRSKTINLIANRLYFIPAYQVISSACEVPLEHYYIHFRTSSPFKNVFSLIKFTKDIECTPLNITLFEELIKKFYSTSVSDKLFINGAFKLILSQFFKNSALIDNKVFRFTNVLNYIDNNISKPIFIHELAAIINLQTNYFSNLFTKTFNITPQEYIISKRINEAMGLLLNKNLTIKEIAYRVGFSDEAYFSRLFKQRCNISPHNFRETQTLY